VFIVLNAASVLPEFYYAITQTSYNDNYYAVTIMCYNTPCTKNVALKSRSRV